MLNNNSQWIDAIALDELPLDDVIGVPVAGRDIALYTVGDEVFATDNICTHGHARLSDGFLDGYEIGCPLHQGQRVGSRMVVLGLIDTQGRVRQ